MKIRAMCTTRSRCVRWGSVVLTSLKEGFPTRVSVLAVYGFFQLSALETLEEKTTRVTSQA